MSKETYKVKFLKYERREGQVLYTIRIVGSSSKSFYIRDRYRAMRDYWKSMQKEYKAAVSDNFPPKKWFGNRDEEFIKQRMVDLEHFFNTLLADETLASSSITKNYFNAKKVKVNEDLSTNKYEVKEEVKTFPIYKKQVNRAEDEKSWRKIADVTTKDYIDVNFGDDPPIPEEIKKKSIRYSESLKETLETIPYVSKILTIPMQSKENSETANSSNANLEVIQEEQAKCAGWIDKKMEEIIKILANSDNKLYDKEEFIVRTRVKASKSI